MESEDRRDAQPSPGEEKPNGSPSKPQEAADKPAQKDSILKWIWKKTGLDPLTIMLMLK